MGGGGGGGGVGGGGGGGGGGGNKEYYGRCANGVKTIFYILNFVLGSEAWGNKTNEMYYSLLSLKIISFVLFPQASQLSMNFNTSELVYCVFTAIQTIT